MGEEKGTKSKGGQIEEGNKGGKDQQKNQGKGNQKGNATPRGKKGSGSQTARSTSAYSTSTTASNTPRSRGGETPRSRGGETPRSQGGETPRDGRSKQKEHFKEELSRLKESLENEAAKIEPAPKKEFTPYTFNTLEPYYNVHTAECLSEMPDETRHGYVNRQTAQGLCDPWVDHRMDVELLPKAESKPVKQDEEDKKKKDDKERPPKEGSTHLPKYPVVSMPAEDYATKQLYFSDVPMLREELRQKYSEGAERKVDEDYKRTKQDFYRMELDKMDEYHPLSRPNMRKTYFAYLQNTSGSRKAVYECVKEVEEKEKEKKKKEKQKQKEQQQQQQQSRRESRASSYHSRQTSQAAA